jgi:DNA-binding NtrC family response regulator
LKVLRVPEVLLVCDADERAILQKVLEPHAELTCACTPEEMSEQLERASYDALFCARSSCMGSWSEVLEKVRQFYPHLPVIVASRTADEQEWLGAIKTGAFDLLSPPYHERVMLSVLEHAIVSHDARLAREGESSKVKVG